MFWLSLKTTLFIEPIKRYQIAAWNQGPIRTSGSVFELTHLFFSSGPGSKHVSYKHGGSPQPQGNTIPITIVRHRDSEPKAHI